MSATLRLAIVTDIHHGLDSFTKKGTAALACLDRFAEFVRAWRPDAVLDLGDRISDETPERDSVLMREVAEALASIEAPIHHLCGNHDVACLAVGDNESVLGCRLGHETVDIGAWRLVLWRPHVRIAPRIGFSLADGDLDWLAQAVAGSDRPMLVASHVPVSGHSQIGNYYFERNPASATYPEAAEIRRALAGAAAPVICIAGHVHWNTLTVVDGVPHFTVQSLTESFTTHPEPACAFAALELGDHIAMTVHGLDPFDVRLPVAPTGRRWVPPLPPFDQLRERQAARG